MGDNRVISIMLSNEALLQRLAASLTVIDEHETLPDQLSSHGDVPAIAGLLVAALAKFQHQSGIKSSVVVLATIEWLMDGMCSDRPLHQVSCLHLWTAWFHGAANSLSPVLDVRRKKKLSFLKDEDGQLDINSRDLRLLTFLLLNIIAKDVGLVQQCATDCIRVLLIYTEERSPTVAHHLIVQPWNQLLLLNISESHASMPAAGAVFSVLLTLVERNVESITIDKLILWSIQWLNSTHVERLLQLKESSTCIDLIEKVLTSKQRRPKLDSQVQKSLISTLEELRNHLQRDKLDVNCRCPREIMFHGSVPLCTNLFSKCCKIRLSKVQHLLGILT
ncbi:PREDICTED: uncharacterized protein LOC106813125 [Priapulus caudatus]|uniref:Uncharacterized protein LOC106813125 n=1 Tax=Priapulus caudatus TaxID=37621 RepID=A0ABM1EKF0_PRICU|nr:PREDICTED: uncharacterized protein LOC106813125 [Priapulus caudatus]